MIVSEGVGRRIFSKREGLPLLAICSPFAVFLPTCAEADLPKSSGSSSTAKTRIALIGTLRIDSDTLHGHVFAVLRHDDDLVSLAIEMSIDEALAAVEPPSRLRAEHVSGADRKLVC